MRIKIIDLLVNTANKVDNPGTIFCNGKLWRYDEAFGAYKNERFQELIRYLHGDYNENYAGLTYPAIYNIEVKVIDEK